MASNRCIKNLLKLICLLQNNSNNKCKLDDGCTRPFLGPSNNFYCYNTRVITLYTRNGSLFTTSYLDSDNNQVSSSLFRVAKVEDDMAVLLILTEDNNEYLSTNNYITVNLSCICAIKCIADVVVQNL